MSRRRLRGTVTRTNTKKTAYVCVARQKIHPLYLKRFVRHTTYPAQNPDNRFGVGDTVVIEESRPISKTKRWVIREKVGQSVIPASPAGGRHPSSVI